MSVAEAIRTNPLASRADAARLLTDLFRPLVPCFSPGRAQVRLGAESAHFDRKAEWFEGWARPLWGLAPLHAGGGRFDHWDLFRQGLVAGTDPAHPEYWELVTGHNQRAVEMAALGFALALAPDQLWDPLPPAARDRAAGWLGHIQTVEMADNNWHFFPVMAGLGLQRVGVAIDQASRDRHLDRIEAFVRSEGWYADGAGRAIDHYNGFALQFYGLIYARHAAGQDPGRAGRYRDRAQAFAQGFRHWFGADGAALAIGRSLTYRFAMAAFWGALAYADVEALPWGVIRGLWARQIRWWLAQPMLDADGRLRIGYRWPNLLMSEEYNSQGSPYWALKAFLPLALPDGHPFWTAAELPLPDGDGVATLRGAAMLVNRHRGDVVALPGGAIRPDMRNSIDKYGKLAYSSRWGLGVEGERWLHVGFTGDNQLALSADGRDWRTRREIQDCRIGDGWIETRWSPLAGTAITTLQGFMRGWEVRLHRITASGPLQAVESGHAVPARSGSRAKLAAAFAAPGPRGLALALDDGSVSAVVDLIGNRRAAALDLAPNTSLTFPQATAPVLTAQLPAGETLLAAAVAAMAETDPAGLQGDLPTAAELMALAEAAGWPRAGLPATVDAEIRIEPRKADDSLTAS